MGTEYLHCCTLWSPLPAERSHRRDRGSHLGAAQLRAPKWKDMSEWLTPLTPATTARRASPAWPCRWPSPPEPYSRPHARRPRGFPPPRAPRSQQWCPPPLSPTSPTTTAPPLLRGEYRVRSGIGDGPCRRARRPHPVRVRTGQALRQIHPATTSARTSGRRCCW